MSAKHIVVMGVSGSGKTTVAEGVAQELGFAFAEADNYHPEANVAKMAAGHPLTDEDRWPWLEALAQWIRERDEAGESTVMACSALRRVYRDVLRRGSEAVEFVHVDGPAQVIRDRMNHRAGHFMPSSLLDSQIATLEALDPDEVGVVLDVSKTKEELVNEAVAWVRSH